MRYQSAATIVFTDANGKQYPVKDHLPVQSYGVGITIDTQQNDDLDEIMSRRTIYGPGSEYLGYAAVDLNIVALMGNDFDVGKIKKLQVPVIA